MVKNLILQVDQIKMQQIHLHGLLEPRKCSAKDDIIDVYAHLRGEGPKASMLKIQDLYYAIRVCSCFSRDQWEQTSRF
jgi:hypothetical protein